MSSRPVLLEGSYSPLWSGSRRPPLPQSGDERAMLTAYLDWHRATLELKCSGIESGRLRERSMPPSTLSLHGLVRHLAGVERWWFQINFAGEQVPMLFYSDDDPDQDFDVGDADFPTDLAVWRRECARSREIAAAHELVALSTGRGCRGPGGPASAVEWAPDAVMRRDDDSFCPLDEGTWQRWTMTNRPVVPEGSHSPVFPGSGRAPLPQTGDERSMLMAYLEWHRATLELKCSGIDPARLRERSMPPSTMSLHGLVRHLAGVERWWFQVNFAGDAVPMLYYSDDDPDQDFEFDDGDAAADLAVWRRECDRSRAIVAAHSLDDEGTRVRDGKPVSLRGVLVKMVAEYAQHNGHADLLREGLDGATGL